MSHQEDGSGVSRREFLAMSTGMAASTLLASAAHAKSKSAPVALNQKKDSKGPTKGRPNILFLFTDQERYFANRPRAHSMPGHDLLERRGVSFTNHQISSCMCTSSRSVLMTGLQTIDNGMFENVDTPYVPNLSKKIPTYGHLLRKAGYYTAYKGKWHLSRDFESPPKGVDLNKEMDEYGFADFYSPGDQVAHDLGGYEMDGLIGESAVSWLRKKGQGLSKEGTPWSLTVSLINPHDIMYFNADAPGENVQDNGKLLMNAARAPDHSAYREKWHAPLSRSLRQPLDEKGRPAAHQEFMKAWGYCLGTIPLQDANWNRFMDFYLNSIRSVDQQIQNILLELDHLGLSENTIVVYSADHGEMAGSHGLRGKGPFAYRETLNVPFVVIHPEVKGGQKCKSLTSHIDLVPTFLSLAGVKKEQAKEWAGRELPGKDLSPVLKEAAKADLHAIRDQVLFVYSGIATNDSEVIRLIAEAKAAGQDPKAAMKKSGYKPNLKKRGSLRTVFDGRYKFSRYFSPIERNSPKNLDELFAMNDVELFDLEKDPGEMKNLALDREKNASLLLEMNQKLEKAIAAEMGKDDGREMPKFPGISWALDRIDL